MKGPNNKCVAKSSDAKTKINKWIKYPSNNWRILRPSYGLFVRYFGSVQRFFTPCLPTWDFQSFSNESISLQNTDIVGGFAHDDCSDCSDCSKVQHIADPNPSAIPKLVRIPSKLHCNLSLCCWLSKLIKVGFQAHSSLKSYRSVSFRFGKANSF